MRNALLFLLSIALLLSGGTGHAFSGEASKTPAAAASRRTVETTVYITRTGTRYHVAGCRYLRQSSIPIALSEARKSYIPCKVCQPPQ